MTPPTAATASDADVIETALRALEAAGTPLAPGAIAKLLRKPFKRDAKALAALLDGEAARGRLHRYVKGKQTGYGLEPPGEFARRGVLAAVSDDPRKWAELKKAPALKAAAKWLAAKPLDAARDALVAGGQVYEWPKPPGKGGSVRYATAPADPRPYLDKALAAFRKELAKAVASLAKAGVTREAVERAARGMLGEGQAPEPAPAAALPTPLRPLHEPAGPKLSTLILERMALEDPAAPTGAPVSIRNLRRSLAFQIPDRGAFDEAVLDLAVAGLVALHRHDHPAGLTDDERAELVPDGRGGFYTAVSVRA